MAAYFITVFLSQLKLPNHDKAITLNRSNENKKVQQKATLAAPAVNYIFKLLKLKIII